MKNINTKLIVFVLIIIAIFMIIFGTKTPSNEQDVEENKMLEFIMEDAKSKFKDADVIEIINVMDLMEKCEGKCMKSTGNYLITVKVVYYKREDGLICPQRYHITYIYPERGFANLPPETIFKDCEICKDSCSITMKEEAIVASFNRDNEVEKFIKAENAYPYVEGKDGDKEWKIIWKGNGKRMEVIVTNNGEVKDKKLIIEEK